MAKENPKIDKEAPAYRIAMLWGSPSAFARALGRRPSTVQRWLENGHIPPAHHEDVTEVAARDGIPLRQEHFVDSRLFKKAVNA